MFPTAGVVGAHPDGDTDTSFAVRLGAGVDVPLSNSVTWTVKSDAYWLDVFTTGDRRTVIIGTPTGSFPIGPWQIDDAVVFSLSTGLRVSF